MQPPIHCVYCKQKLKENKKPDALYCVYNECENCALTYQTITLIGEVVIRKEIARTETHKIMIVWSYFDDPSKNTTHYFNSGKFQALPNNIPYDITFDRLKKLLVFL